MIKIFSTLVLTLIALSTFGQQKVMRYNVRIKPKHCVYRIDTTEFIIDTCIIKKGTIVKTEKIIKTKCCDSTFSLVDTVKEDYFRIDTARKIKATLLKRQYWDSVGVKRAKANITISKDSLLTNFWLYSTGSNCNITERTNAPFSTNKKYFMQLKNRQYISLWYHNIELGALNIPLKVRPSYDLNGNKIYASASANITNIGTYVGYRLGKIKYSYNKYEDVKSNSSGFVFGAFFGVANEKLDSLSTIRGGVDGLKKSETRDLVALSYGLMAIYDIADFRIGVMVGKDRAFGDNKKIWNYDNRIWFGFGIGYKLTFLRNPEK